MLKTDISMSLNTPQPMPQDGDGTDIFSLVIADLKERDALGASLYNNKHLQAGDGRDHLVDAYQESMDQTVYIRQEIEWRKNLPGIIEAILVRRIYENGHRGIGGTLDTTNEIVAAILSHRI